MLLPFAAITLCVSVSLQSKVLHQKALQIALDKFGVAHATTTLARGNLVDALDQLGEREEARQLLNDSVDSIKEVRQAMVYCTGAVG